MALPWRMARPRWIALALLCLIVPCLMAPTLAAQEPERFNRYQLNLLAEMAEIIPFDLTGDGGKELLVVEVDRSQRDPRPSLRVFHRQGTDYRPNPDAAVDLPNNLAMLAVGRFPDGTALVMLMPNRLQLWPWAQGRFHPERAVTIEQDSIYKEPERFNRYQLNLLAEMAEIIPFDLTGDGGKELLVVEVDRSQRDPRPSLRVFHRQGTDYRPNPDAAVDLPNNLAMLAVGRFPDGTALVMLMPNRLQLWPWAQGRFHPERAVTIEQDSIYKEPGGAIKTGLEEESYVEPGGAIEASLSWITDLDGDRFDEIVVPRLNGFQVLRVKSGWKLLTHARLQTRSRSRLWPWLKELYVAYKLPIARVLELNGGGWKDLVAYVDGIVQVFYLDGKPSSKARGPDREFDLQPPRPFDPKKPWDPPLKLARAEDLNGDGLLDMVFTKVAPTSSSMKTNTRVLVYYGRSDGNGGFAFSDKPDQVFASEGFTHPILVDINGDNYTDLALVNVEVGFWTVVKALITRTVSAETAIYLMQAKGKYPGEPNEVVDYSVNFSLGRFSHRPITSFGDFNGDGRPDLLLSANKNGLGIHWGSADGAWNDDYDYLIEDFLPTRTRGVRLGDIDGDRRDDLIFIYNRNDIRQMPEVNGKFTVLLSRFAKPKRNIASDPANSSEQSQ